MDLSVFFYEYIISYSGAGTQPALHFGGRQFSWNFIRWLHRAD